MTTDKLFQRHTISMPALGHGFKLGDLYGYNADEIVRGNRLIHLFNLHFLKSKFKIKINLTVRFAPSMGTG